MPGVDLVDETFIVAASTDLAAVVADPARWDEWWPELKLTVFMDRGERGIRWSVSGSMVGSCEIWLEPVQDGTLVHHYLRVEPADPSVPQGSRPYPDSPAGWRHAAKERDRFARAWKKHVWALKDEMEGDREVGLGRDHTPS